MKLHVRAALLPLACLAGVAAVAACNHPQKRNDWRSPSPPMVCGSDADCRGGTCAIELGATQGTCSGGVSLPPLPGPRAPDGGAHPGPPGPGPNVQPSPNDIQI